MENKFKIACILNERRLKGQSGVALSNKTDKENKVFNYPQISAGELLDEFPKKASEFLNRTLNNLCLLTKSTHPFENIRLENKDYLHFFIPDKQGCYTFLRELAEQGYIRFNRVQGGEQLDVFCLTTKCWDMVENMQQTDEIHDSSNGGKTSMEWDVFICHASEDKLDFVEPLANALKDTGIKVWYDRFEFKLGDSLRGKIDEGLGNSRYGVIVLSSYFFKKEWPKTELDALVSRQNEKGEKVILPIWHGIGIEEVRKFSPILASKFAAQSSESLESIVVQIKNVLNENSTPKKPAKDKRESEETGKGNKGPLKTMLHPTTKNIVEIIEKLKTLQAKVIDLINKKSIVPDDKVSEIAEKFDSIVKLKQKDKTKGNVAKIIKLTKQAEILKMQREVSWPEDIKRLMNEIIVFIFPFLDYLKEKGTSGKWEQASIEFFIKAGIPSQLYDMIQELEKIKHKIEVESQQSAPQQSAETGKGNKAN